MSPMMGSSSAAGGDDVSRTLLEIAKISDPKALAEEWAKLQSARDEIAAEKHQAETIRAQQLDDLGAIVGREVAVGKRETAVQTAHQMNVTASGNLATISEILDAKAQQLDERVRRLDDREVTLGNSEATAMRAGLLLDKRQEKLNARQALLDRVIGSIQAAAKNLDAV